MPSPRFLLPLVIGVAAVAFLIYGVLFVQKGAHVELKGSILKVRTHELDQASSVAVADFRFVNPSDYPFIVRKVDVKIEDKDGKEIEGAAVAEADAKRLFEAYPLLGQKFNTTLLLRDRINARQSEDRMIAARFEIPVAELNARKQLTVRIEDVDGPVSELREK
jgi:hypothetical protein